MTTEMLTCGYKGCTRRLTPSAYFKDEADCLIHGPRTIGHQTFDIPRREALPEHVGTPRAGTGRIGADRLAIMAVLKEDPGPLTTVEIADQAGLSVTGAYNILRKMLAVDEVRVLGQVRIEDVDPRGGKRRANVWVQA